MARTTRQRMLDGTIALLARRGLQETSFSRVLEHTGTPRGSVYFHFPEGKSQLVQEALALASARSLERIADLRGSSAVEVTARYLDGWRLLLTRSEFQAGCAAVAVTVATDSDELLGVADGAFASWQEGLATALREGGLREPDARGFAAVLVAACEGAVVLSRAARSYEPFDAVRDQLIRQVEALAGA